MRIARVVNQMIRPLGLQIARVPKQVAGHARTDPFFDCLVKLGFKPKHFVDVGANRGGWTRTALKYFSDAYFSMFEPQETMRHEVADLTRNERVKFYSMGAGPSNATMKLTVHSRDDSYTFALDEVHASALGFSQIEAPVVALDDFLPKTGWLPPDVLKTDAEGWDLQVLRGAMKTLRSCEVVLLEAAIMCKTFTNRIDVVLATMRENGYVLFDITDLNRTDFQNALWLVEAAFVKQGGELDSQVTRYS